MYIDVLYKKYIPFLYDENKYVEICMYYTRGDYNKPRGYYISYSVVTYDKQLDRDLTKMYLKEYKPVEFHLFTCHRQTNTYDLYYKNWYDCNYYLQQYCKDNNILLKED